MSTYEGDIETQPPIVITGTYLPEQPPPQIYFLPDYEYQSFLPNSGSGAYNQPPAPPVCPEFGRRDNKAVTFAHEGGVITTGYVLRPASEFPNSGLTIGAGVDLGAKSVSELQSYGISQEGLNTLLPYFGYKGQAAIDRVAQLGGRGPVISASDAQRISDGAYAQNISIMIARFNASSPIPYERLPEEAQTVLADLGYQKPNLATYPNFFSYVTSGNWGAAVSELRHWRSDGTSPQRMLELADRLERAITEGKLSPNGHCQ